MRRLLAFLALTALGCTSRVDAIDDAGGTAERELARGATGAGHLEVYRPRSREACVDAWLAARALNAFGDAEGTTYAGGTPLFDERTGAREDRLRQLFVKHPELAQTCP